MSAASLHHFRKRKTRRFHTSPHPHPSGGSGNAMMSLSGKVERLEKTLRVFQNEVGMKLKIIQQILSTRNEQVAVQTNLLNREQTLYNTLLKQWMSTTDLASNGVSVNFTADVPENQANGTDFDGDDYSEQENLETSMTNSSYTPLKSRKSRRKRRKVADTRKTQYHNSTPIHPTQAEEPNASVELFNSLDFDNNSDSEGSVENVMNDIWPLFLKKDMKASTRQNAGNHSGSSGSSGALGKEEAKTQEAKMKCFYGLLKEYPILRYKSKSPHVTLAKQEAIESLRIRFEEKTGESCTVAQILKKIHNVKRFPEKRTAMYRAKSWID